MFLARSASENSLTYASHRPLILVVALLSVVYVAWRLIRVTDDPGLTFRRGFVLIVCALYFLALKSFWPVTSHDDRPPFYPLVAVLYFALCWPISLVALRLERRIDAALGIKQHS